MNDFTMNLNQWNNSDFKCPKCNGKTQVKKHMVYIPKTNKIDYTTRKRRCKDCDWKQKDLKC